MEQCFHCGNCKLGDTMYYCPAKNEFIIEEKVTVIEKRRSDSGWKEGAPAYEKRRRKVRQEKDNLQKIV